MRTTNKIRRALTVFVALLALSGLTAFPIRTEIDFLQKNAHHFPAFLQQWIETLSGTLSSTPEIVLYGTDWLAFAHLVIALFFMPVFIDPVKHKANVIVGIIACVAVFPLAFICG